MNPVQRTSPDLDTLVDLFFDSPNQLGVFVEVEAEAIPEVYQKLLVHDAHMTVTVEQHHGCPVDVQVVDCRMTASHYSRKILLNRTTDGKVVQFGIVRLDLGHLGAKVRQEIELRSAPLGRILIEHDVLRKVKLLSLWKITPGEELRRHFGIEESTTCYGRTALIYCNGVIAIELLEIVTPE